MLRMLQNSFVNVDTRFYENVLKMFENIFSNETFQKYHRNIFNSLVLYKYKDVESAQQKFSGLSAVH